MGALQVAHLVIDPSLLWVLECLKGFIEFLKLVCVATCCTSKNSCSATIAETLEKSCAEAS